MTATLATLLSLFTALIGTAIGHLLAERKSRRDDLARMRLEAYTDFIEGASLLVSARRMGRTLDEARELGPLNDAKARICICAPAPVVEALEQFWAQGGTLEREQEILAFARLCRSMRTSLGCESLSSDAKLSGVLFKLEPSTYSYRIAASEKRLASR